MKYINIIIGFVWLSFYFNFPPKIFSLLGGPLWVVFSLTVFIVIYLLVKLQQLDGLRAIGYSFPKGWHKLFLLGIGLAVAVGVGKYLIFDAFLKYQITRLNVADTAWILVQGVILAFLGSTLNDAITRGYWFAHLSGKLPTGTIIILTSFIYAADDIWNEGFNIFNSLWSIIIGLSLATAYAKYQNIWMSTGLHTGINLLYYVLFGVPGSVGILTETKSISGQTLEWISLMFAAILFALVFLFTRSNKCLIRNILMK